MDTTTYIPLPVEDYVRHRLEGDRCGEEHPDLRNDWQTIKNLPNYPNNTDWAEVVAEWDSERYEVYLPVEMERLLSIVARHQEQTEYGECQVCEASAWVNPVGECQGCEQ